ncbi:ATP-binding protein [Roseofilum capinflatum]|uniref:histidine kinase n=1 Tax=Roseofilum capinflatum BLCC-M114 TaxID=3022440 RepID=A0ABT7B7D2_9CYAN|nr:ATP-binding protein [Roseofilum capinflatum]MDJ1175081.1 ATP-binding protein [Roseofilum capinflatum BLCC-M114]
MLKFFRLLQSTETSFRRILLGRILLMTIPVLLLLQYATYRKARSSLLETARYNIVESALKKADLVHLSINGLTDQVITASESGILQSGDVSKIDPYLQELSQRFYDSVVSDSVVCLQLQSLTGDKIIASTCGVEAIANLSTEKITQKPSPQSSSPVKVELLTDNPHSTLDRYGQDKLHFLISASVDNTSGEPLATLVLEAALPLKHIQERKSLSGYTVILNQEGTIIAHLDNSQIGTNIDEISDVNLKSRLDVIMRSATGGQSNFLHLPQFDQSGKEVITGYTAIPNPTTDGSTQGQWVVLAVTPLDHALYGLQEIRQTLINLVLGLIAANLIATLILARSLVSPVEQLGKYAKSVECSVSPEAIPQHFKIHEFNQLAQALNSMVERLTSWAEELEVAWQEAKSSNQLKSEFLASISHELRTPLNAILGSVRLVKDGFCDDKEEELDFLQQVDNAAMHLLSIINDILDLSKIEAGKLSLELEAVDLNQVLQEVIDIESGSIHSKGLSLTYERQIEAIAVYADVDKLKQVFMNVIGNAIKFTEQGGITIAVEKMEEDGALKTNGNSSSPSQAVVRIKDTGIGIEPSSQSKLFEPFVMGDGSRTRKFEGTGLGLAISRNLIQMMEGQITLYSEGEGKGTTVEILLPLIDVKQLQRSQALKTEV